MCDSHQLNDTFDTSRDEEAHEVRRLLRQRATGRIHWGFWLTAIGFTAAAVLAWGFLLSHGLPDDTTTMTRRDGAIVGLFVVLGGAAIGSIAVFVTARNHQRLAAERDRIDKHLASERETRDAECRDKQHAELLDALDNLRGEKWQAMMAELGRQAGQGGDVVGIRPSRSVK